MSYSAMLGSWKFSSSGPWNILEESTYGTSQATTGIAWSGIDGRVVDFDWNADFGVTRIPQFGGYDAAEHNKMGEMYEAFITYLPYGSIFMGYGISTESGNRPFTLWTAIDATGTRYLKLLGTNVYSMTFATAPLSPIIVTAYIGSKEVPAYDTATTPSGTQAPAGITSGTWNHQSGGSGPIYFTSGSTTITPPVGQITLTVAQPKFYQYTVGDYQKTNQPTMGRAVTGRMTLIWDSGTRYTAFQGWASQYDANRFAWRLNSGSAVLRGSGFYLTRLADQDFRANGDTYEVWDYACNELRLDTA